MFKIVCLLLVFWTVLGQSCDSTTCVCSNNVCVSCVSSFMVLANSNICLPCPSECAKCSSSTICTACQLNYYLSNSTCQLCRQYCLTCTSSSHCTSCMTGYSLSSSACQPCPITNTLTCDSTGLVLSCISGYWQNGNSCSPCRQFCLICSSPSNCLQCQTGYYVAVSFGSYCQACSIGCLTCSSIGCSQCGYNYQLNGTTCVSISSNCSSIAQCQSCVVSNSLLKCSICTYPYYLTGGACTLGASLMCRNGASGVMYYDCLDGCGPYGYSSGTKGSNLVCLVYPWLNGMEQVYINAYDPIFSGMLVSAGQEQIYYDQAVNSDRINSSIITITVTLSPYYKTAIQLKLVLINSTSSTIAISLTLSDNSSNSEQHNSTHAINNNTYQPIYININSQKIKNQIVTIALESTTDNISVPVIGLAELLIQIYPCPSNCRLCFNAQLCITCISTYFNTPDYLCASSCQGYLQLYLPSGDALSYTSKQCVLSCPDKFYAQILNSTYICNKCTGICLTCLSSSQCLSCVSGYIYYQINFECLTGCPSTHYESNGSCVLCSAPCATCSSISTCLSCSVGYFTNGTCNLVCPSGSYANTTAMTCDSCATGCTSCQNSPYFCLSCESPLLLFENSCIGKCTSTMYYENNGICTACLSPCYTCTTNSSCLSCLVGYLYLDSCLITCLQGYYADALTSSCVLCSNSCLTCQSDTLCTSCPNSTYLYSYQCLSTCPISTYPSSRLCLDCLQPCSSCLNQTYCLSCSIGYLSNVTMGSCLSACQSGYYGYAINSSCLMCNASCTTCSGTASSCTSCSSSLLLQGSSCLTNCSTGYYAHSGTCLTCSFPCLSCSTTAYTCLTCQSPYILINGSCLSQCPTYSYLFSSVCLPCVSPCLACSSVSVCLSCVVDVTNQTYLVNGQCLITCPDGSFADSVTLTCRICSYPCLTCTSEVTCLSCLNGYLNPSTRTCQICSGLYFANTTSQLCQLCSISIANCSQCLSSTQCTLCANNTYIYHSTCITSTACLSLGNYYADVGQGSCVACLSPCLACVDATYCSSCMSGLLLAGSCVSICGQGYYSQNGSCWSCPTECLTCSNSTACLTCNSTSPLSVYFSQYLTCIIPANCISGYYIDSSLGWQICSKCQSPCSTCSNTSYCTSCLSGLLLDGSCKSVCPSGYYANTSSNITICSLCDSNCFKCVFSATNCSACSVNLYLKNGSCVSTCGGGYYLDTYVYQCFKCVTPCDNCSSASICLSCINSTYLLYQSSCLLLCPGGTYQINSTCQQCPSTCLTCSLATLNSTTPTCLQCASTLYMSMSTPGQCVSSCGTNQYGDVATSYCYSCVDPCVSCTSAVNCLSCVSGYLLLGSECLNISRCPSGYYLLEKSCITDCGVLWAIDSTAICGNQCLSPALKKQIGSMNKCVQSCGQGYKVDLNYICTLCTTTNCQNLLSVSMQLKSIFNILYLKLSFSQKVNLDTLTNGLSLSVQPITGRRLFSGTVGYQVVGVYLDAVWLQLAINQSVRQSIFTAQFMDYYILGPPLQQLTHSTSIATFDVYPTSEEQAAIKYEQYSEVMSTLMLLLFALDIVLNSGYLSYLILDYYQLLFMVLFLAVDYPPHLNHFLYGFRITHYLFLPQIFRGDSTNDYSSNTPDKFGVIVPDVYFLNNAGPALIVIGVGIGVLLACKGMQMIVHKIGKWRRSNQVGDQSEGNEVRVEVENQQHRSEQRKQEREEQHGKCYKLLQEVVARFKWNYFNDLIYSVYFSLMLFAFSQLFELTWRADSLLDNTSIVLAFLVVLAGIAFPFALTYLLYKEKNSLTEMSLEKQKLQIQQRNREQRNKRQQENLVRQNELSQPSEKQSSISKQEVRPYQILTDYKCFVSGIKLRVRIGFYHIPIKYGKKLILACLLVYCSQYPSLVLGIAMMFCLINLLISLILRPYRLTFQQIIYPIFDMLYLLVFLTICIMQLPVLDLGQQQKLNAGYLAIALCIVVSLLLFVHNVVINVVEIAKYCCGKDYFQKYYQTEYVSTTEHDEQTEEEQSCQGLNKKGEEEEEVEREKQKSQSVISGLDLYLRRDETAPKYLIKCMKPEEEGNDFIIRRGSQQRQSLKVTDIIVSHKEAPDINDESEQSEIEKNISLAEKRNETENGIKEKKEKQSNSKQKEGENIFSNIRTIEIEWDD